MLRSSASSTRTAVLALLLATVFWGCGFTWAKTAGESINSLRNLPQGSPLGPIWVLALRFLSGGLFWLIVFPDSRRNWSGQDLARSLILGLVLSLGMVIQHLGLDRTTEAVSAFLTSLTILFVPLMMTFVLAQPPRPIIWLGVILATAGVWLMTGASPTGFGIGELLGLACAVTYSIDIIIVNKLITPQSASRLTAGQFLIVGASTAITTLFVPSGPGSWLRAPQLILHQNVGINIALLMLFPTLGAFGLQFRFQPRIDPSRAALIYLMEPTFASLFAYLMTQRGLSPIAMTGAALIILANATVELMSSKATEQPLGSPVID